MVGEINMELEADVNLRFSTEHIRKALSIHQRQNKTGTSEWVKTLISPFFKHN